MPLDLAHPEAEIQKAVGSTTETIRAMIRSGELDILLGWGLNIISAILILIASRVIGTFVARRIAASHRIDPTLASFLATFARYAIAAIAIVTILGQFGVQTASLLAVMGAAGLAIGLALQGTLSNVAAGVMLLILRPFRVGDTINVDRITGTVKALGLFGTEINTADNVYIFTPNSRLWNNDIINYSRNPQRRQDLAFRVGYNEDLPRAIAIIHATLQQDERIIQNDSSKKPQVLVDRTGDLAIEIIVRFWSRREDFGDLRHDVTKNVITALSAQGITIPSLPAAAV